MSEQKIHRNRGIVIGLGIALILLGSFGWFSVSSLYGILWRIFVEVGLDPSRHYLFRTLNMLISGYMTFSVAGVVALILGVFSDRKRVLNGLFEPSRNPLVGAVWGGGGVLAIISLQNLLYYLLVSDQIYLKFSIVEGSIGIFLIILGIIAKKRKT